ncbi:MAG: hypothetical protein IPL87_02095 [Candidatus Moraniibacteriota bacterium]|nr:MAG: hypothetical protein IPL87_02095 [Candidatus Moranbacteria bacterium]
MGLLSKVLGRGTATEVLLALDIGTEIVKALVFRIEPGARGTVLGVGWVRQKSGNMQSGAVSDIAGVIESCREAILLAEEQAGVKKVRKSIVGIAGELVKGTTTTVHYERVDQTVKITLSELRMIVEKVQEKAYERIQKQLAGKQTKHKSTCDLLTPRWWMFASTDIE